MRRTERLIASLLSVALLGMIAAPPALASREPKPDPRCGFVSVRGRLNLNASGLLSHYPKAQADTVLIVKRDGTLLNGYPVTFKSDTHTPHFTTPGHYVAKFKTETGVVKVSCNGTLSAGDTTPPVVTVPADITVDAGASGDVVVNYTASATDAGSSIAVSCSPASGSTFPVGPTLVTCSATDASGNSSYATFVVTVRDVTGPVLTIPADITVEATGPDGAVVAFSATATDIQGPVFPSCLPQSGDTFPLGTTTVTCVGTDTSGNTSSGSFLVTVKDTTAPVLTVPVDGTVPETGPYGAVVAFTTSATDASGPVDVSCLPESGSTFALGTTTVTCTASDPSGNTTFATFHVTVSDMTAPVLTLPTDITVPETGPSGAVVTFTATASDDSGPVAVSCLPGSGDTFAVGTTIVECLASDPQATAAPDRSRSP